MDKVLLLEKLNKGGYSHSQLLGWVNAMPGSSHYKTPKELRMGDVFMHPVFKHPYILLKKSKDEWISGLITTEESCDIILEPCISRFFEGSHITKCLFNVKEVRGSFLGVYSNDKHLREVFKKLKSLY